MPSYGFATGSAAGAREISAPTIRRLDELQDELNKVSERLLNHTSSFRSYANDLLGTIPEDGSEKVSEPPVGRLNAVLNTVSVIHRQLTYLETQFSRLTTV